MADKFSGALYQLYAPHKLHIGAYVKINGPHDTYGVILKITPENGEFLHLIRGVKKHAEKPIYSF